MLLSTMVIAMPEVVNEGDEGFFAHKDLVLFLVVEILWIVLY